MQFSELITKLGSTIAASSLETASHLHPILTGLAPIETATSGTISYIEGDKFAKFVSSTAASALILPMNQAIQTQATERGIAWIAASEPRLLFAQVIKLFYQPFRLPCRLLLTMVKSVNGTHKTTSRFSGASSI